MSQLPFIFDGAGVWQVHHSLAPFLPLFSLPHPLALSFLFSPSTHRSHVSDGFARSRVPSKVTTGTCTSNIHQHQHVGYDGVYRIEKCWRINGIQGYQVCRYLFVRCDNEPAPWTSDEHGDRPRPLPEIAELNGAADDITCRKGNPSWDYDEGKECWLWKKPPPKSKKSVHIKSEDETTVRVKQKVENVSVNKSLSNEFCCQICGKVISSPLTTPCAHNFCKICLESAFAGQSFIRNRACHDGRTLQAQKNIMKCPSCSNDIADFLQNLHVLAECR